MSAPATPTMASSPANGGARSSFIPLVSVVDFHHARGPEVERWFGVEEGRDPAAEYDWGLLPFMALSDGAHALTEDFSYFTLLRPATAADPTPTSLFGISCTRQMDASQLLVRPPDVTRSTVQKAVVVIADSPQYFGMLRERLSVVTKAWFAQREFTDTEILRRFQESLADEKERGMMNEEEDRDQYLGLSLRELVREFRWQTLVLLKCCLLQPKMLFFGTRCERLCLTQFSLVSLIPGLLRNLQDSAGPELNNYEKRLTRPTSLRTSDRNSLLSYMGLPLQIFGKGSLFGPYTPLQQLDILADFGTKSYIVGSTNSLLLQQRDRYSDILINLDEGTINITSTSLKAALQLSVPDRRWIDFITQTINDTWDESNPSRPKTLGYAGSEEFIRMQFEEYLLALISSVKYRSHLAKHANNPRMLLPDVEGDPSVDFGIDFLEAWSRTENFRIWNSNTDSHLFDIVDPTHPCAGGLTIEDVQRRIAQQVQDMHWDERFAQGKEALGRNLAAGKEKASTILNKLYADMEAMREANRKKAEEAKAQQAAVPEKQPEKNGGGGGVAVKAGAFVNSWAAWAGEKRKAAGWGKSSTDTQSSSGSGGSGGGGSGGGGGGGGWTVGWGRGNKSKPRTSESDEKEPLTPRTPLPPPSPGQAPSDKSHGAKSDDKNEGARLLNRGSLSGESILDGAASDMSSPMASPERRRRPLSAGSSVGTETTGIDTVVSGVKELAVEEKKPGTGSTSNGGDAAAPKKTAGQPENEPERPVTPPAVVAAVAEASAAQSAWEK